MNDKCSNCACLNPTGVTICGWCGSNMEKEKAEQIMNEQTDTPRTDARLIEYTTTSLPEYCKLLEAELAAAREELLDSQKETLMAKAYKNTLKTENSHLKSKLIAVTEQRDMLAHACETITITGSAEYCRQIADDALQSLYPKP